MSTQEILATSASCAECGGGSLTGRDGFAMRHLGERSDHNARTRHLGSPTQIQVLAQQCDDGIEAVQRGEEVGAHQSDAAGRDEDVALQVLLTVVDLTFFDALARDPEAIARLADVQERDRIFVLDELGRHDPRVRPIRRFDHQLERVRLEAHVVVTEEEKGRPLHHESGLVARGAKSAIFIQHSHERVRRDRRHALGDARCIAVGDHQEAQLLVVLRRQRRRRGFKTRSGAGGDDDGNNGRSTRFHQFIKASWPQPVSNGIE